MDIIRWSINRPVSIAVGVLLVVLFGLIGVTAIPIQLTPTVDRPIVKVTTNWPGREPQEVVDEVTRKQEEKLKNVSNLRTMRSTSRQGGNEIELEFNVGVDINRALQDTAEALRQVESYPEEVDQPFIASTEGGIENAIAWLIIDLTPEGRKLFPAFDVASLYTGIDREVKPYLERTDGVAEVRVFGGTERQVQVEIDPVALATRGITYAEALGALRGENRDVSAGTIDQGKREVRVRVLGRFTDLSQIASTVIAYREGKPVYVRDVGDVSLGFEKRTGFVRTGADDCLAMPVMRQSGANVVKVMADVRQKLGEIRADILPRLDSNVGKHLRLRQVYDETTYISASVDLVKDNLWQGGALAIVVLLLFLRSFKATGIIALAIPLCVIATFLVILAAGRTLNVISLAGLAFSTGMVVDNAIVVLENIVRRRDLGDPPLEAVYRGAKEVWTAILASTLTTAVVFIPVLTIREEAGQLFFDLTLALATSVLISVAVAITAVPSAAGLLFRTIKSGGPRSKTAWEELFGLAKLGAALARALGNFVHWLITGARAHVLRPLIIVGMVVLSLLGSRYLAPPLDYLPQGNQNLVFGFMVIPPGQSVESQRRIAARVEGVVAPYMAADITKPETVAALPKIQRGGMGAGPPPPPFDPVPIGQFFIGSFQGGMFCGGFSQDPLRVQPLVPLLSAAINMNPDTMGFASQSSIFRSGARGSSGVEIEVSGPDLTRVTNAVKAMRGIAFGKMGEIGFPMANPFNYDLDQTDTIVRLNDRGRELGLRTGELGTAVRALFDGAFAGEYTNEGRTIDIVVIPRGGRLADLSRLPSIPIRTPTGQVVPLSTVADFLPGKGPQEIRRSEELPSVVLQLSPPPGRPLELVIKQIEDEIIAPVKGMGLIDSTMRVKLEGTAAKLDQVRNSLFGHPTGEKPGPFLTIVRYASWALLGAGAIVAVVCLVRGARRGTPGTLYATIGALLMSLILGGLLLAVADRPEFLMARFVWASLVCYLLMAALFESFLYPFVIMFSVPSGVVGGFAALRLVHDWTLRHPDRGTPQNLDVLTMIGFFILIGTVVNNAILLVEQTLNFMHPEKLGEAFAGEKALPIHRAIAEAVRTRLRPVMMTTLTTIGGGLPLVLSPGAGSEMYRGLGAVVCGGLLVSTIFTLILVPLVLSLVFDMKAGLARVFGVEASSLEAPSRLASAPAPTHANGDGRL